MKDDFPRPPRHAVGASLCAIALAFLAGDAVAASPCGCTWPSADHINTYSNMLAAANAVESYRDAAMKGYDNAKKAWAELSKKRAKLNEMLSSYRSVETDYRRLGSLISPLLLEGAPDGIRAAATTLRDLSARVDELDGLWREVTVDDGGWSEYRRQGEAESAAIDENFQLFDDKVVEARRLRGHGIDLPCVRNLYSERVERSRTDMESLRKNLEKARDAARNDGRDAEALQDQISGYRQSIDAFPSQIAANNRQSGIATAKALLAFLEDRALPRVRVRFLSGGEPVPDGDVSLKKGVDPLDKILDPARTGFVFLGWRERNTRELFTAWGKPVDRDLDLDAVWGHQIRVAGLDEPFDVPAENNLNPSLSRVFHDPRFTKFADSLRSPVPGKRLAGWRDYESKALVDETMPVARSMSIEPVWEDLVFTVTWQDADGTYLDETRFRASEAVRSRPLPEDRGGFRYQHWSTSPDGESWNGFGKPLEYDITLFAVRDADHVVRYVLSNGTELPSGGFRNGQEFSPGLAPVPPLQKGLVFEGWFDESGHDFAGRKVTRPVTLRGRYRKETADESITRVFSPIEVRFPLPLLVAADVAALVLFIVLLPKRRREARGPRSAGERSDASAEPGPSEAGGAAEAVSPEAGGAAGESGTVAANALPVLIALSTVLPTAAFAGSAGPAAPTPVLAQSFDPHVLVYPGLLLLLVVLVLADVMFALSRICRAIGSGLSRIASARGGSHGHTHGGTGGDAAPEKEVCPTCGVDLVDGECPAGHTIVRCSKCSSIMRDGVCPHCGVGGEQEFCPTCNSELVDGECPRGHTIVRCPDCGSILQEGVCPKGCNADPLNLGWPGGAERTLSTFALQVVECPKSEGQGFTLRIPDAFVVGRSSTDAKEPFVELLTITRKEKAQCSRQYVRFDRGGANGAFTVTLLNSSRNPAFVDGKKLVMQGDTAPISLGGRIKLNPGYELELVEAPMEG